MPLPTPRPPGGAKRRGGPAAEGAEPARRTCGPRRSRRRRSRGRAAGTAGRRRPGAAAGAAGRRRSPSGTTTAPLVRGRVALVEPPVTERRGTTFEVGVGVPSRGSKSARDPRSTPSDQPGTRRERKVNDTALIGGFEEAGRDRAAGHKVRRAASGRASPRRRTSAQAPPPPSSLVDAQKALCGPRTGEDGCCSPEFVRSRSFQARGVLHEAPSDEAEARPRGLRVRHTMAATRKRRSRPRKFPCKSTASRRCMRWRQTRKPVLSEGEAVLPSALDAGMRRRPNSHERKSHARHLRRGRARSLRTRTRASGWGCACGGVRRLRCR